MVQIGGHNSQFRVLVPGELFDAPLLIGRDADHGAEANRRAQRRTARRSGGHARDKGR